MKTALLRLGIIASALLGLSIAGAVSASDSGSSPPATPVAVSIPDTELEQFIVKYSTVRPTITATSLALAEGVAAALGARIIPVRLLATGAHLLRLDRPLPTSVLLKLNDAIVAADPTVEYAEPDYIASAAFTPNDPSFFSQWHYYEPTGGINVQSAWDQSSGNGVVVAVLDTGYRPHVDLAGNLLPGYDFIWEVTSANDGNGRDADASDPGDARSANECPFARNARQSTWHGTQVGGIVSAVTGNGIGIAGVAFGARVLPVRVLGKCDGATSDVAEGDHLGGGRICRRSSCKRQPCQDHQSVLVGNTGRRM